MSIKETKDNSAELAAKLAKKREKIAKVWQQRKERWGKLYPDSKYAKYAKPKENLEEGYPTRKHFKQVAELISQLPQEQRLTAAKHHAGIFAKQNPRFKHEVFLRACGVPDDQNNLRENLVNAVLENRLVEAQDSFINLIEQIKQRKLLESKKRVSATKFTNVGPALQKAFDEIDTAFSPEEMKKSHQELMKMRENDPGFKKYRENRARNKNKPQDLLVHIMKENKTMSDLTDIQWAKINGHNAGREGRPSHHNPYEKNTKEREIWNLAHEAASKGKEYKLTEGFQKWKAVRKDLKEANTPDQIKAKLLKHLTRKLATAEKIEKIIKQASKANKAEEVAQKLLKKNNLEENKIGELLIKHQEGSLSPEEARQLKNLKQQNKKSSTGPKKPAKVK